MSLKRIRLLCSRNTHHAFRLLSSNFIYGSRNAHGASNSGSNDCALVRNLYACTFQSTNWFCTTALARDDDVVSELQGMSVNLSDNISINEAKKVEKVKASSVKEVDFSKIDVNLLPTVLLIGRPNVGKSALFNRLIRRREALVYNTPNDHVTRDIRDGIAKLGDLRFKVLDSAGLEAEASSGSVLSRTAEMTGNVLRRSKVVLFLTDARDGLLPMDLDVGKWLRRHASGIKIIVVMNKAESLLDSVGSLDKASGEAHKLGFGDAIALSAETGLGMTELYATLRPLLEDYMRETSNGMTTYPPKNCFLLYLSIFTPLGLEYL